MSSLLLLLLHDLIHDGLSVQLVKIISKADICGIGTSHAASHKHFYLGAISDIVLDPKKAADFKSKWSAKAEEMGMLGLQDLNYRKIREWTMYSITVMLEIIMPYLSIKVIHLKHYKRITQVHVSLLLRCYFPQKQLLKRAWK